jgi:TRAP-type C4-dicarboxylate transport system permease small subunit
VSGNKDEKKFPSFRCDTMPPGVLTADTPKNIFDKIVINGFSIITFSTTVLLTVIICAAAFFRYILDGDLTGYEEWVKIFAFWLYFSAAAIGAYNRTHVSADLVQAYVPDGKLKNFLVFLKDLVTVGVCLLFTWYGYEFFMFGFMGPLGTGIALPTTNVWRISLWVGYLPVFMGLIFMSYYFTRDLFMSTVTLLTGRKYK